MIVARGRPAINALLVALLLGLIELHPTAEEVFHLTLKLIFLLEEGLLLLALSSLGSLPNLVHYIHHSLVLTKPSMVVPICCIEFFHRSLQETMFAELVQFLIYNNSTFLLQVCCGLLLQPASQFLEAALG